MDIILKQNSEKMIKLCEVSLEIFTLSIYKNYSCIEGGLKMLNYGWPVSTLSTVQSAFLALALIIVGALLYKEEISLNKVIGIVICLIGLYFINKK